MDCLEPKKLALIRIYQIFKEYSDYDHPLTQDDISNYLDKDYGIIIERKAISRNISLLKEAGVEIKSRRVGSYLESREFEDSELRMLIDGVLSSKYITAKHSKALIEKLCRLSNKYFKTHVKNIYRKQEKNLTGIIIILLITGIRITVRKQSKEIMKPFRKSFPFRILFLQSFRKGLICRRHKL